MNCLRSSRRLLLSCRSAAAVNILGSIRTSLSRHVRALPPQAMRNARYYRRFAASERLNILGSIRTSLSPHVRWSPLPPLHHGSVPRFDRWYHKPCKVAAVAALASGATAVAAFCSRYDREIVPYTNRAHWVQFSPQSEFEFWDPQDREDKKVWASQSLMVDPLHPDSVRVCLIADKVLRATYRTLDIGSQKDGKTWLAQRQTKHLDGLKWEVILIKDEEAHVEATPTGKLIVFTGLLDDFKTDAEIAFSLAHEVGHIIARHQSEIAYTKWFPLPLWFASFRRNEIEADHIGMLLLGAAGFHPNNALKCLWKLAKIDGPTTVVENLLSPWPSYKKRMEHLSQPEVMEKAMKLYRESTPDQGSVTQAADTGFSFQETLGDIFNIISTRLKQVLRGRSTN